MTKQIRIITEDEIRCKIEGLDADHRELFVNAYAVYAPNYRFNPSFKMGRWDGKIRFFTYSGHTFIALLPEILPTVVKLGYKIELVDSGRTGTSFNPPLIDENYFRHILDPETKLPLILRDYQVRAVNLLIEAGNGIEVAATGAGKTIICGALSKSYNDLGARVLVIVPSVSLIKQTREEFLFLGIDTGEYSGNTKDIGSDKTIVVSTWQSLKNNPTLVTNSHVVIVDECHGAKATVLQDLINNAAANIPHRFGVTGTLPEHPADEMTIKCSLGQVVDTISASALIERGVLATLHVFMLSLVETLKDEYKEYVDKLPEKTKPVPIEKFRQTYLPDYSAEKSYINKKQERLAWMADFIEFRRHENGNTLVLVQSVKMGQTLSKLIPDAHFVYGDDDDEVRSRVYNLFKSHDNVVAIATYGIASTGLSIKRIKELFLIDLGKSFVRVIQSIGRGLRTAPDKKHINVWDVGSNLTHSAKHATSRKAMYKKANYPYTSKKIDYMAELEEAKINKLVEFDE